MSLHGTWNALMAAPINDRVRKNLEASFTALSRLSLNEQTNSKKLLLFQNSFQNTTILFFYLVIMCNSLINCFYPSNMFDVLSCKYIY